jgi:hypothetical protein
MGKLTPIFGTIPAIKKVNRQPRTIGVSKFQAGILQLMAIATPQLAKGPALELIIGGSFSRTWNSHSSISDRVVVETICGLAHRRIPLLTIAFCCLRPKYLQRLKECVVTHSKFIPARNTDGRLTFPVVYSHHSRMVPAKAISRVDWTASWRLMPESRGVGHDPLY